MKHKKLPFLILLLFSIFFIASCDNKNNNSSNSNNQVQEPEVEEVETTYTVLHYLENLNDDQYTIDSSEEITAVSNHKTEAVAKSYPGFTAKAFDQKKIMPDGSTAIKIYYERIKHRVSVNTSNKGTSTGAGEYKYGQTVSVTINPNAGYEFDVWYANGSFVSVNSTYTFEMGLTDVTLEAKFITQYIEYAVEHYQENLSGGYTIVTNDTQILGGEAFSQTNAEARSYTGFTAKQFSQAEINPNGETVIKIYYDRVSNNVTISNSNVDMGSATGDGSFKYGESITLTATPATGCIVEGWYVNNHKVCTDEQYTFTMGTEAVTVEIRFAFENVNYTVEHYQENADTDGYTLVTKDTETKSGTPNTLTAATAKNYTGFNNPTITQETINADGTTVVKIYYKRIRCTLNVSYNDSKAGTVSGAGTYKYGQTVTISATPNEGYGFAGWATSSTYVTVNNTTNPRQVTVTTNSTTYYAKFTVNAHDININVSGTSKNNVTISGTLSSYGEGLYGYKYTVIVNDKNIVSIKVGNGTAVMSKSATFVMPNADVSIDIVVSPYVREGNSVYYGFYPQTKIDSSTNSALITELNILRGSSLPSPTNLNGWKDYKYYINSTVTSFMYYKDVQYNGDYYRAIYFTQYRPYITSFASSTSYSLQDDNNYNTNTVYWFKVEPIKWKILEEANGKVLIYSDLIIDSREFYFDSSDGKTNHYYNGTYIGNGYSNNYELSSIRKFLANDFAMNFSSEQIGLLNDTLVDNSASSTHSESNPYYSNNTNDRIFLLSNKEIRNYLKTDAERVASATDYALSQGYSYYYWLRSPYLQSGNHVEVISDSGSLSATFNTHTRCGVRPACWITL